MTNPIKIILSGGGTGGHLFPAIAIADSFKEKFPDTKILFVGAKGKMEMEKIPEAGYDIKGLWIGGFQRKNMLRNLTLPFKIISSLIKSRKIIKDFKPDMVVGTGGYASFALIYVASLMKVPTLIQEQNFFPGVTNKFLSKRVNKICTVDESLKAFFPNEKIVVTGNPVRESIKEKKLSKEESLKTFGLDKGKKTVLIIGGSLGARTINNSILKGLDKLLAKDIQIIWQSGKFYFEELKTELDKKNSKNIWLNAFIKDMSSAYSVADVVVSRAGAITLSELAISEKVAILCPSPNVAEDHQTKNAMALVNKNAVAIIKDNEAEEKLADLILDIIFDKSKQETFKQNISALAKPDSANEIVKEIEKLLI
ncbi:MAG: undecaprenyldiphospho-muramoylpentapeptide beta-N-acetylglucosaminyltransferase [Bacteroidota bacterium]|nr:undecaprenyldiphospho-muramoylpentapeptide beta-N-acetylglucosaminyltransferase [Bacteroidota bacterium]